MFQTTNQPVFELKSIDFSRFFGDSAIVLDWFWMLGESDRKAMGFHHQISG